MYVQCVSLLYVCLLYIWLEYWYSTVDTVAGGLLVESYVREYQMPSCIQKDPLPCTTVPVQYRDMWVN